MNIPWIDSFKRYWANKKHKHLDTFCLEVLGSEEERTKYAGLCEQIDFNYLIEVLSIKKEREQKKKDPLTAREFWHFFKSCKIEIDNEKMRREKKKSKSQW